MSALEFQVKEGVVSLWKNEVPSCWSSFFDGRPPFFSVLLFQQSVMTGLFFSEEFGMYRKRKKMVMDNYLALVPTELRVPSAWGKELPIAIATDLQDLTAGAWYLRDDYSKPNPMFLKTRVSDFLTVDELKGVLAGNAKKISSFIEVKAQQRTGTYVEGKKGIKSLQQVLARVLTPEVLSEYDFRERTAVRQYINTPANTLVGPLMTHTLNINKRRLYRVLRNYAYLTNKAAPWKEIEAQL